MSYQPPKAAQRNAQKVLDWRKKYPHKIEGMTEVGWRRAKQLASGKPISAASVKAMAQFNRHRNNYERAMWDQPHESWTEAAIVAWLGWGGTAGIDWARRESKKMTRKKNPDNRTSVKYYPLGVWEDIMGSLSKDPEVSGAHKKKAKSLIARIKRYMNRKTIDRSGTGSKLETEASNLLDAHSRRMQRKYGSKKKTTRKKNPRKPTLFSIVRAPVKQVSDFRYLAGFVDGDAEKPRFTLTHGDRATYPTKDGAAKLARSLPGQSKYFYLVIPSSMRQATVRKNIQGAVLGKSRRANPVGPTQKQVDEAARLFRDFTGDHPERLTKMRLPNPKTGVVIGELDGVLYTTVRDGKTEHYQHDFRKGSRPLLASAHDGESLHILGGEYEFTERGIEDR